MSIMIIRFLSVFNYNVVLYYYITFVHTVDTMSCFVTLQLVVPFINFSSDFLNSINASNVRYKMLTVIGPGLKTSSHANQGMSFVSQKNKGKAKRLKVTYPQK